MALRCEMSQLEYYGKVLEDNETCVNFLTAHGILVAIHPYN